MKKWSNTEIGIAISLVVLFGLTFALLIVERYFSIVELDDVIFGLSGAYLSGSFDTYSELESDCDSTSQLAQYCETLSDLEFAGQALQIVLIFDILVLLLFILTMIGTRLLLKKLVSLVLDKSGLRPSYVSLAKWVIACRFVVFFHPFLLVLGALYWSSEGKVRDLTGTLQFEPGLVIFIVHGMFSLGFCASYAYYVSSSKRRNILLMLQSQIRKHSKSPTKIEPSKLDLVEVSLDF